MERVRPILRIVTGLLLAECLAGATSAAPSGTPSVVVVTPVASLTAAQLVDSGAIATSSTKRCKRARAELVGGEVTTCRRSVAFTGGTVAGVSSARMDMVRYLIERDVGVARFVGAGREATAAAFVVAGGSISADDGTTVVWLADEVSQSPIPDISGGLAGGGTVIVEASLPGDAELTPNLLPVLVEIDRVVLLSCDGDSYRRIEFVNGGSKARPITPLGLDELDALMLQGATSHQLVRRDADTSGQEFADHHPAHLSWFRHNSAEPDTEIRTSH